MAGTELLLSMVEARLARNGNGNGNGSNMESGEKTHQELEKIEQQIARLQVAAGPDENTQREIQLLNDRIQALRKDMESSHSKAWEKTELARHPQRPYLLDYVERIFTDWSEIHGDRGYADDPAIIGGMARFHGEEVMIVGHQKARDTKQKVYRNFGMPNPGGLPQGHAGDEDCGKISAVRCSLLWTRQAPIPAWARKNADRRKPSRTTCARWRDCRFPSSPRLPAKVEAAAHWPSPSPTAS